MQKNSFSSAHVSGTLVNMTFSWNSHIICSLLKGCRTLPHSAALCRTLNSNFDLVFGEPGKASDSWPTLVFLSMLYIWEERPVTPWLLVPRLLVLWLLVPWLFVPRASRPPGCSFLGCLIAVTAASSTTFPWACIKVFFNTLNGKFSFAVNALCWLGHYTEMHKLVFFKPWQPEHHCVKAVLKKAQVEI